MSKVIYLATRSVHKQHEIIQLLKLNGCTNFAIRLATDLNPQINWDETGDSFIANAQIKALALTQYNTSDYILADDSGLCVDALNGAPGVYSARFAGNSASDQDNIAALLAQLKNTPDTRRQAHFNCTLLLLTPTGADTKEHIFVGECHGRITDSAQGKAGFGYDPIFYYPPLNKTFAELSSAEKNAVSHRGQAMAKLVNFLKSL